MVLLRSMYLIWLLVAVGKNNENRNRNKAWLDPVHTDFFQKK